MSRTRIYTTKEGRKGSKKKKKETQMKKYHQNGRGKKKVVKKCQVSVVFLGFVVDGACSKSSPHRS